MCVYSKVFQEAVSPPKSPLTEMLPQPTASLCVQFTIRGTDISMTSLASWCQQYALLSHRTMSQGLWCLPLGRDYLQHDCSLSLSMACCRWICLKCKKKQQQPKNEQRTKIIFLNQNHSLYSRNILTRLMFWITHKILLFSFTVCVCMKRICITKTKCN